MKLEIATYREGIPWTVVTLSPTEALHLAESLIRQARTGDPNSGRPEFHVRGGYFTVYVMPEEDVKYPEGPDGVFSMDKEIHYMQERIAAGLGVPKELLQDEHPLHALEREKKKADEEK
jgi:hypothetical protein